MGVIEDEDDICDVSSWIIVIFSVGYYFENVDLCFIVDNVFNWDVFMVYGLGRGFDVFNYDLFGMCYIFVFSYYFY